MHAGIDRFLAKASGPFKFCSELRGKTKSVRNFRNPLNTINAVGTEVPKSVFGGDILALMSGRLRQLLQSAEQPESADDTVAGRSRFTPPPDVRGSDQANFDLNSISAKASTKSFESLTAPVSAKRSPWTSQPDMRLPSDKAKFDLSPGFARKSAKPFTQPASPLQNPNRLLPTSILKNSVAGTDLSAPQPASKDMLSIQEPEAAMPGPDRTSISGKGDIPEKRGGSGQTSTIFIEKLREYWRLSGQAQTAEQKGIQRTDVKPEKERNGLALSPLPKSALGARSWPQMTGGQVAQKLGAFVSGNIDAAKRVEQALHPRASEKVRIQNTFHIEVKSEGDRTTDLSESIADILREQALQHGIDIT